MLPCEKFFSCLQEEGVSFFTGVPDSLLKAPGAYIQDHFPGKQHVIAANEGSAVALASGYHLATGKIPLVYMQNSGLGNTINPLVSLASPGVYSIPMLLMIGWRGEPDVKDEPQHQGQGKITPDQLELLGIPFEVLAQEDDAMKGQISQLLNKAKTENRPVAILVKKNTFDSYSLQNKLPVTSQTKREDVIESLCRLTANLDAKVIATTGKTSRELYETRKRLGQSGANDFLTVGSMGHANQIALAIAMYAPEKKVFCLDGDGAFIMHMGGNAAIRALQPANFYHIMLNNGCHESVGGQPTAAIGMDFKSLSQSFGYKKYFQCSDLESLAQVFDGFVAGPGPNFLEVHIAPGSRADLGRPKETPLENKTQFMAGF